MRVFILATFMYAYCTNLKVENVACLVVGLGVISLQLHGQLPQVLLNCWPLHRYIIHAHQYRAAPALPLPLKVLPLQINEKYTSKENNANKNSRFANAISCIGKCKRHVTVRAQSCYLMYIWFWSVDAILLNHIGETNLLTAKESNAHSKRIPCGYVSGLLLSREVSHIETHE